MLPKTSTPQKTKGPYYLYVQCFTAPGKTKTIEILKVNIVSNNTREFLAIQNDSLPAKLRIEPKAVAFSYTDYRFPCEMNFNFKDKEEIVATILCKSGEWEKEMIFEFKPKKMKGLFQLVD
jgi:hypothetical protein